MSTFDDAMRSAEEALLAKRSPRPKAPKPAAPNEVKQSATITSDGVTVNGVDLASISYVDESNRALRDDLNAALDGIEAGPSKPLQVEVKTADDVVIGKIDGATHYQLPDLLKLCAMRMHVMVKGELGGGKSTAAKQVAEALGLSFGYIGQTMMPHDVMGYVHPVTSEYMWTPFTKAFVEGGVVVLEEMDGWSANATLVLNPALANGYITLPNGEMHEKHPDCVIIACTNTWGTGATAEYVGRNKLDSAFLDRFGAKLDWKYDLDLERMVAGNDEVVDAVQNARRNAKKAGIQVAISPRASIDISRMVAAGFTMREAMGLNFLSGLDADQRKTVLSEV